MARFLRGKLNLKKKYLNDVLRHMNRGIGLYSGYQATNDSQPL